MWEDWELMAEFSALIKNKNVSQYLKKSSIIFCTIFFLSLNIYIDVNQRISYELMSTWLYFMSMSVSIWIMSILLIKIKFWL